MPLRSFCGACYSFGTNHETGECAACRRLLPLKKGYCRLCWAQASLAAKGQVTVLEPFLRKIRYHQLFLAGLHRAAKKIPRAGTRTDATTSRFPSLLPRPSLTPGPS